MKQWIRKQSVEYVNKKWKCKQKWISKQSAEYVNKNWNFKQKTNMWTKSWKCKQIAEVLTKCFRNK